jgi:hypothetical protein
MSYSFVSNDTGSILQVTCTKASDNSAINLTGATVKLKWFNPARTVVERTMTLVTPLSGIVNYQFLAGDLYAPAMSFEVEITDSGGFRTTVLDPIVVEVRPEFN